MPTNMPPPRKLPQRSWAASIPTILTHSALHVLLLPSPTPGLSPALAGSYLCSPLERFLGSVNMRRHLQRIIQQETVRTVFQYTTKLAFMLLGLVNVTAGPCSGLRNSWKIPTTCFDTACPNFNMQKLGICFTMDTAEGGLTLYENWPVVEKLAHSGTL